MSSTVPSKYSSFILVYYLCFILFISYVLCESADDTKSCGCGSGKSRDSSSASECKKSETKPFEKYLENGGHVIESTDNCVQTDKNVEDAEEHGEKNDFESAVLIKGGTFQMGTDKPIFVADGEGPSRKVTLDDFYLDVHEVSNKDFEMFVEKTGHVTEVNYVKQISYSTILFFF